MATGKISVLMLTWEFPPRIIGGISSHVSGLSAGLAHKGATVHVVTCDFPGAPEYEQAQGVHVYRFNSKIPSYSFLGWVLSMNQAMAERAIDVINANNEDVDIIHAHDWLVADAAVKVRNAFDKPLVSTIHATETGRRGGIHNDYQKTINEVETQLIKQSSQVICCSKYMLDQVRQTFRTAKDKLSVIPNGVNVDRFDHPADTRSIMKRFAKKHEKLVVYVGRLVHEKGVHVLIGAAPKVLEKLPNVNFVIVGEGGMKDYLLKEAWDFGIADHVFFTGFVDQETLVSIYKAGDVAVFPSLYEPFGITALEAMAAKTPVVVSDTGGLAEIVDHDHTGIKVYSDNSDSLAWGILRILQNKKLATQIREKAFQKVHQRYSWAKITDETVDVYCKAILQGPSSNLKLKLNLPFFKFGKYPEDMRILLLLHFLGAIESEHATRIPEMADILRIDVARIKILLQRLLDLGYVEAFRDSMRRMNYYLTRTGIIKACSLFS